MKHIIIISSLYIASLALQGCNKYLDVSPKSSLSEDQLFTSELGFQQALTGVYAQMAGRSLYGDNLSMGFVAALAQNYAVSGSSAPFVQTRALNYASDEVLGYTNAIWSSSYASIAGLNKLIANTESKRNVLSATGYSLVRGEALGLRAYLHFELLRMFGPAYENDPAGKAIPYQVTVGPLSTIPSTAEEVVNKALADLEEAAELLKDADPIMTGSTSRRIKMNYYAVKGLEARIRLFKGDKAGAFSAAETVVNSGKFSFVTPSAISAAAGLRDRLFMPELVFSLRVRDIKDWAEVSYFKFYGSANMRLTRSASDFNTLYEVAAGGGTDIRFNYLIEEDKGTKFPSKFWQTYQFTNSLDTFRLDQMVPLIRMSEMYYIMAETAATPEEGTTYLNMVRRNRAIPELVPANMNATTLRDQITKEHQKEFYAEGQLFYYYKRLNFLRMQFRSVNMTPAQYRLPIPESELEFNPNYQ